MSKGGGQKFLQTKDEFLQTKDEFLQTKDPRTNVFF